MPERSLKPPAVMAVGADLRVVGWDQGMEQLTGTPAADALGRPCWLVLGARSPSGAAVCTDDCKLAQRVRDQQRGEAEQVVIRTKAGSRSLVLATTAASVLDQPLLLHVICAPGMLESELGARPRLTPRQHEVLALLADGRTTCEIAETLGIARETARNHVRGVLHGLSARTRLEAVARARRHGLIP